MSFGLGNDKVVRISLSRDCVDLDPPVSVSYADVW